MTKEDNKEEKLKRVLKTLGMYPIKTLRTYTIKKVIEMKNLIKMIKGHGHYILKWLYNVKVMILKREVWF